MAGGGVAALGVHTERAAQYKGRMTLAVAMTCLVAAVGGAIFGYDIGISGTHASLSSSPPGSLPLSAFKSQPGMDGRIAAGRWPAPQSFRQPRTHRPLAPRRRALGGGQV